LISTQIHTLVKKVGRLFPNLKLEVAYARAGTFGETEDGLAYIGVHPFTIFNTGDNERALRVLGAPGISIGVNTPLPAFPVAPYSLFMKRERYFQSQRPADTRPQAHKHHGPSHDECAAAGPGADES